MATVLELIDAETEAFHSNVETGSLDDKSPRHSASLVEESSFPGCGRITGLTETNLLPSRAHELNEVPKANGSGC